MLVRLADKTREQRRMLLGPPPARTQPAKVCGGQHMKTVWRTLVSASFMAAIGAGCGGGNDGGADTGALTAGPSAIGDSVLDSPLLVPLVEFFRHSSSSPGGRDYETPTLVSNDSGDLLLVWDNRVDGKVRSMFYHPASGWAAPEVVTTKPVATEPFGQFNAWIDKQGNAVIQEELSFNEFVATHRIGNFFVHTDGAWKRADYLKDGVDLARPLLEAMTVFPDHSELGVLYLVSYLPSDAIPGNVGHPQVLRLKSDGKWDKLAATPTLAPGELPLAACNVDCFSGMKTASNDKGDLVLAFAARANGVRAVMYSVERGWGDVTILDTNSSLSKPSITKAAAIGSDQKAAVLWFDGANNSLKLALRDIQAFVTADVVPSEFNVAPETPPTISFYEQRVSVIKPLVTDGKYQGSLGTYYVPGQPWGEVARSDFSDNLREADRISFGWIANGYALAWTKQESLYVQQLKKTGWTDARVYPLVKSSNLDFTMINFRFAVSGTNLIGIVRGRDGLHSVKWTIQ